MTVKDKQISFLKHEFASLAWNGAVQHAGVYKDNIQEEKRAKNAKEALINFEKTEYEKQVTSSEQFQKIEKFSACLKEKCGDIFHDDRLFAVSQKALNLYLKYLWCAGILAFEPSHCPIDNVVLAKIGKKLGWHNMTHEQYQEIMKEIDKKAERKGIAVLELEIWNKYQGNI